MLKKSSIVGGTLLIFLVALWQFAGWLLTDQLQLVRATSSLASKLNFPALGIFIISQTLAVIFDSPPPTNCQMICFREPSVFIYIISFIIFGIILFFIGALVSKLYLKIKNNFYKTN